MKQNSKKMKKPTASTRKSVHGLEKAVNWIGMPRQTRIGTRTKKYEKYKRLVSEEILPQQDLMMKNELTGWQSCVRIKQKKEYLKAAEQETTD